MIEIVRLQHRDPTSIREAITPLLDERGAISQIDNNLIISTSRANLAQLEALIVELDVPRRQLRISVDFRYGRPSVPQPISIGSATTTLSTDTAEDSIQSIVVTEGEYAHFNLTSGSPVGGLNFTDIGALLEQQRGQTTQSISLTAQPRGATAVLEIATLRSEPDLNGILQTSVVNTTVDIGLNQWQVVAVNNANPVTTGFITSTVQPLSTAVRVEVLP
ncbi:MAG: hypothetical protein Q8L60_01420 [Gammaproteobacteria bacterium]|nr:hypothetical protein [Gammaproteobacteria bacterium]MDP2141209.1 hypothetical protein [Gammaproteobacteria bacterium]MDP2349117.1 hypothetical protein [Gammaproteobacteria bacterium]